MQKSFGQMLRDEVYSRCIICHEKLSDDELKEGKRRGIAVEVCKKCESDTDPNMMTNQCDGCNRGLPIEDGCHMEGDHVYMGCTKSLYADPKIPNNPCPYCKSKDTVSSMLRKSKTIVITCSACGGISKKGGTQ